MGMPHSTTEDLQRFGIFPGVDRPSEQSVPQLSDPHPERFVIEVSDRGGIQRRHVRIGLDRGGQLFEHGNPSIRKTQLMPEFIQPPDMPLDRRFPHLLKRLPGEGRGHVRIPITIATDPGSVSKKSGNLDLAFPHHLHRLLEISMQPGDRVPDDPREVMHSVADFIGDVQALGPHLIGSHQKSQQSSSLRFDRSHLGRGLRRSVETPHQNAQPRLLPNDTASSSLGGMGGEGRFDVDSVEDPVDLVDRAALRGQSHAGSIDGFGPGTLRSGRQFTFAIHPHDVPLLGLVTKVKADRQVLEHPPDPLQRDFSELFQPVPGIGVVRPATRNDPPDLREVNGNVVRLDLVEAICEPTDITMQ